MAACWSAATAGGALLTPTPANGTGSSAAASVFSPPSAALPRVDRSNDAVTKGKSFFGEVQLRLRPPSAGGLRKCTSVTVRAAAPKQDAFVRVEVGDTLGTIARAFGTTPSAFVTANKGLVPSLDLIFEGDLLRVPPSSWSGVPPPGFEDRIILKDARAPGLFSGVLATGSAPGRSGPASSAAAAGGGGSTLFAVGIVLAAAGAVAVLRKKQVQPETPSKLGASSGSSGTDSSTWAARSVAVAPADSSENLVTTVEVAAAVAEVAPTASAAAPAASEVEAAPSAPASPGLPDFLRGPYQSDLLEAPMPNQNLQASILIGGPGSGINAKLVAEAADSAAFAAAFAAAADSKAEASSKEANGAAVGPEVSPAQIASPTPAPASAPAPAAVPVLATAAAPAAAAAGSAEAAVEGAEATNAGWRFRDMIFGSDTTLFKFGSDVSSSSDDEGGLSPAAQRRWKVGSLLDQQAEPASLYVHGGSSNSSSSSSEASIPGKPLGPYSLGAAASDPAKDQIVAESGEKSSSGVDAAVKSAIPALALGVGVVSAVTGGWQGAMEAIGLTAVGSFAAYDLIWAEEREKLLKDLSQIRSPDDVRKFLERRGISPKW